MCLGGKSKGAPPTPAPTQPTQFGYVSADDSNSKQRQAAIMSSTGQDSMSGGTSFGSELGSSGPAASNPATGAM